MVVGICRLPGQQPRGMASRHCQQHTRAMKRRQQQCLTAMVGHEPDCWCSLQGHNPLVTLCNSFTRNIGPESMDNND